VNQILDYSKIEAGKLELEEINFEFRKIIQNIASVVATSAHEKGLELFFSLSPDIPRHLLGDPTRLLQVLINLTSNAVKFTDAGEVAVKVDVEDQRDSRVILKFAVRDTGIGLAIREKARLFDAFTQADGSMTRKFGGTGLGLTISRQIVERMGGQIDVESEPGQGSTFWFTAEFGVPADSVENDPPALVGISGTKILVVDDTDGHRELLCQALSHLPVEFEAVGSGPEALKAIERAAISDNKPFDMVLMDWKMPGMDGIETATRISQDANRPSIPTIIMVTAYDRQEIAEKAEAAGVAALLLKPVSSAELYVTISDVSARPSSHPSSAPLSETQNPISGSLTGIRVLLVEDNEVNRLAVTEMLNEANASVDIAEDGRQALQMVGESEAPYDVVLMDVQMPVMDGLEATRMMRKNHTPEDLPVIAMTAHVLAEERDKCASAGMNDFLSKPVTSDLLMKMVLNWSRQPDAATAFAGNEEAASIESDNVTGESDNIAGLGELEGIDVKATLEKFKVKPDLLARLMGKFHDQYTDFLEHLSQALAQHDLPRGENLVHGVSGSAGYIGADALQQEAVRLENMLREGKNEDLEVQVSKFTQEFQIVLRSTARFSGHK